VCPSVPPERLGRVYSHSASMNLSVIGRCRPADSINITGTVPETTVIFGGQCPKQDRRGNNSGGKEKMSGNPNS
jgi:hypothetical protein